MEWNGMQCWGMGLNKSPDTEEAKISLSITARGKRLHCSTVCSYWKPKADSQWLFGCLRNEGINAGSEVDLYKVAHLLCCSVLWARQWFCLYELAASALGEQGSLAIMPIMQIRTVSPGCPLIWRKIWNIWAFTHESASAIWVFSTESQSCSGTEKGLVTTIPLYLLFFRYLDIFYSRFPLWSLPSEGWNRDCCISMTTEHTVWDRHVQLSGKYMTELLIFLSHIGTCVQCGNIWKSCSFSFPI